MQREQPISFIGSGNVAWHLAPALDNVGFVVKEVYSRNPQHAALLTNRLYQAEVKASLDFSTSPSRIFVVATADDAIESIAREIVLPDEALLIHTSGSMPLTALQYAAPSYCGVFYPLQSFTKEKKVDFKLIPIFTEAHTEVAQETLQFMASRISRQVLKITSEERKSLHLAAVFASNFTNHMIALSEAVMKKNGLDFDWLKPLIVETIEKSLSIGPTSAQTGPARRGDLEILDRHLEQLHDDERLAELYKIVSQHILDQYSEI